MAQNNQQVQTGASQPTDDNQLHYKTLVHLFSLASQEFYNRFTAMVLSHTILLTGLIIGFNLFSDTHLDKCMKIVAIVIDLVGIGLCAVWLLLLRQSLDAQSFFQAEGKKLENENKLKFKIFSCGKWQSLSRGSHSIRCLSTITIIFFFIVYIVLLLFIAIV